MRSAVAFVLLVAPLVACGRGDDGSVPRLQIVSLTAAGRTGEIVFVAEDDSGDPLDITIDWGDRSTLDRFSGSGELESTHEYADDIDSPVVIVELANSAGESVRTGRTLALAAATTTSTTTTTTTTAPSTTTTTAPTTTSTTVPPTTTTSTTTTTTTTTTSTTTTTTTTTLPPTTTTTTTTTTLPPEPVEVVVPLSFDDADNDELTEGTYSRADVVDDDEVELVARTGGNTDDAYAAVVATWTIDWKSYPELGDADAPSVSVFLDAITDLTMATGKNDGRAALYSFDLRGTSGGAEIGTGSSTVRSIDDDADFDDVVDDTVGFGTQLESGATDPIVIELTIECTAFGGTTIFQIGEESRCEADFRALELRLTLSRDD